MTLLSIWRQKLTPREREIADSVLEGCENGDIAQERGCEVATVKVRVFRAVRALEQIYLTLEREKVS